MYVLQNFCYINQGDYKVKKLLKFGTRGASTATVIIFFFVISSQQAVGQDKESIHDRIGEEKTAASQQIMPDEQEEKEKSETNTWLIYGGAAAFGLGVAVIANNTEDSSAPPCSQPPVGASIGGSDWKGTLTIRARGFEGQQEVTAKIIQCGSNVTIETSSTLAYGKLFTGSISSGRGMFMIDQATSLDWTTYSTKATANAIDLYDYVNNFNNFDTLILRR